MCDYDYLYDSHFLLYCLFFLGAILIQKADILAVERVTKTLTIRKKCTKGQTEAKCTTMDHKNAGSDGKNH